MGLTCIKEHRPEHSLWDERWKNGCAQCEIERLLAANEDLLENFQKVERLWKEYAIADSKKRDTIIGLENATRVLLAEHKKLHLIVQQFLADLKAHDCLYEWWRPIEQAIGGGK
jgi:hypothetical protein